jgi:excinuclease UvrABC ATPase subunit
LEVNFHGKNIHDVLEMSVDESIEFFSSSSLEQAKMGLL